MLLRCRVLMSPDASCESIGSWMRYTWNPRRHMTARDVADAVFLAQAGVRCIGGRRDEILVAEVARLMQETSSRQPQTSKRQVNTLHHHITEHDVWMSASGRSNYEDLHTSGAELAHPLTSAEELLPGVQTQCERRAFLHKRTRLTAELPDEMTAAVRQSLNRHGRMDALQFDVQHLHARQRGATHSVMHGHLSSWLESDAGKAWKQERELLLQADEYTM